MAIKKLVFIFLLAISPHLASARFGWSTRSLSLQYGRVFYNQFGELNSFELLLDHANGGCVRRWPDSYYKGISIKSSFNSNYLEIGIKGIIGPKFSRIPLTRNITGLGYAFFQANYASLNSAEQNKNDFNFRPGIGVVTDIQTKSILVFKPAVEFGYTLNPLIESSATPLTFEIKMGIGLNLHKMKWNRQKREKLKSES